MWIAIRTLVQLIASGAVGRPTELAPRLAGVARSNPPELSQCVPSMEGGYVRETGSDLGTVTQTVVSLIAGGAVGLSTTTIVTSLVVPT